MVRPGKGKVVALCGGVGGAKLAYGLSRLLGNRLVLIVNTGDDFEHLGLSISPDIDTVLYTLSGLANRELGWGRQDETWNFMSALETIGGETWFRLGDRDLALHVERTRRLGEGETLTRIVADFAYRFEIAATILPMSNYPIRTMVATAEGMLPFQRYFVEQRCAPPVNGVVFKGSRAAVASKQVLGALEIPDLRAIVICPSNPFLSIDPILSVPGIRERIEKSSAPVVAVSPIIGGKAVKGPTDKIMAELGVPATSNAIMRHYGGLLDGLIIDTYDERDRADLSGNVRVARTLMKTDDDRGQLATAVLDFADQLTAMAIARRERQ
ncbi:MULTISPECIES: 2-phospho-L-lactate transferase [unclassified Mesorhizobium]|uniref:2-phospho-L-lactate transferase n=1 Tax=unclassified Mesorhizobium TaxID=325217 RepID=UPI001125F5A6|nr:MULTISPECIES: 2-phospho-L-lactate transferase [unclassified Mesorhizobium]MBZ9810980.1 2-phospho-L-lactate transferase [Mesorhizobium sp. ESP-6-2]TPM27857.1 2-phospho-L-lactate transferase [Mesorhizobium sp. B2-2-2]